MAENVSCREKFSETLLELARKDKDIYVVTSDARGSCSLGDYANELPEQFIEVGIAEQDEIGIAAGLASVGKRPYVCAPACFLTARSLEQIKVDVAYSHQNVKIFGVSGGVSYGALGASHHTLHDIAVLRAIPDIMIFLPCDGNQTKALLKALQHTDCAAYIRVGRAGVPEIYPDNAPFEIGKANTLRNGNNLTIIAAGESVWYALAAAEKLAGKGVSARVVDMHTLRPFDEETVICAARETGKILTVEEHSVNGGLGAAVAQTVCENYPVKVHRLGMPDEYLVAGNSSELFHHYGMDTEGIFNAAMNMAGR
jgi:transketolase